MNLLKCTKNIDLLGQIDPYSRITDSEVQSTNTALWLSSNRQNHLALMREF